MTNSAPALNHIPCHIRQVEFVLAEIACDRCGHPAPRVDTATRTAVDVDLDHPALLLVRVSVHRCAACRHYLRAQPPFLRPDAIYTQRVVRKAVEAVYADGMAFRRVGARLGRDFWVQPSEAMIRRWRRTYGAAMPLDAAYHAWVAAEFSGILCVDEVYQRDLALLLAVDPAAPDGDRMVGYQLVHGRVDASAVAGFLGRLAAAGIHPDEVITDGSPLYPGVLAEVWPRAAHQLCLFHETRRVTRAVLSVIERVRRALPSPPPPRRRERGRLLHPHHAHEQAAKPRAPHWYAQQEARYREIVRAQELARQGLSQRAVARQRGVTHTTVKRWLAASPAPPAAPPPPDPEPRWLSWLRDRRALDTSRLSTPPLALAAREREAALTVEPAPPEPWESWAQVRRVREDLRAHRYLLLRRPAHLTIKQCDSVTRLLSSPIGPPLGDARSFLTDWYAIWWANDGRRRTEGEARLRYEAWRADARYGAVAPLRRVQTQATDERFGRLSPFLRNPRWEATNNGAERAGRAFRHRQGPHFNLRSRASIDQALAVTAQRRKTAATMHELQPVAAGRRGRAVQVAPVAASDRMAA